MNLGALLADIDENQKIPKDDGPFVEFICGCERETQKEFTRLIHGSDKKEHPEK